MKSNLRPLLSAAALLPIVGLLAAALMGRGPAAAAPLVPFLAIVVLLVVEQFVAHLPARLPKGWARRAADASALAAVPAASVLPPPPGLPVRPVWRPASRPPAPRTSRRIAALVAQA